MSFAQNIQYLRKLRGITQEELSDLVGVSRQSVSKWETGDAFPETEKIMQLCDIFNVSMDVLMRGDGHNFCGCGDSIHLPGRHTQSVAPCVGGLYIRARSRHFYRRNYQKKGLRGGRNNARTARFCDSVRRGDLPAYRFFMRPVAPRVGDIHCRDNTFNNFRHHKRGNKKQQKKVSSGERGSPVFLYIGKPCATCPQCLPYA